MFLALAFGLFLTAPLVLLVASIVQTAAGVSRRKEASEHPKADVPPAVAGRERRDFFGDAEVARRPVTKIVPADVTPSATVPTEAVATDVEDAGSSTGTLLEFPRREAQLERLRSQYATR